MPDIAIQVQNLGKRYNIGELHRYHNTLRDSLADSSRRLIQGLRHLGTSPARNGDRPDRADYIWALKDITFEVERGEVLGIIGHNGAGKSTLLKILSRITEPTTGEAIIDGRVGSLLEVGTGFHPELTGRDNVYLNGAILGMRRQEIARQFDEIVSFAGVERFIDTPVKRYSSGMKVRLAFAVAAHLEPEILVIDEVLAVGDAEFQKRCLGKMASISSQGRTILFVSHNMSAVTRLCSRAILLQGGEMVADGPPTEIVASYLGLDQEGMGAREWSLEEAPGDDNVRLASMSLLSASGEHLPVVSVEEDVVLRIGVWVGRPNLKFRIAARFYTQGVCAFTSVEPREIVRQQGMQYASVAIPAHLLAEGEYHVGISIFSSMGRKVHYVLADDTLIFQVTDPLKGDSARGDYTQPMVGVMRPRLQWEWDGGEGA